MAAASGAWSPTLRVRLTLLAFAAVSPALLLIVSDQAVMRRELRDEARTAARDAARAAAANQAAAIDSTARTLATLSELSAMREDPPLGCPERLEFFVGRRPQIVRLVVARTDGVVLCSASRAGVARMPATWRPPIVARAASADRTVLGGLRRLSAGLTAATVARPVADAEGRTIAVIVAVIVAPALALDAGSALTGGATLTLADRDGHVIDRSPWDPELVGRPAPIADEHVRFAAPVETTIDDGLQLFLDADLAVLFSGADAAFGRQMRLIVFILLGTSVAALLGGELLVVRPVRMLQRVTARLAGGELSARADQSGAPGLDQIATSLNELGATLQRREREQEAHEARLRASEAGLRQLFEASPMATWVEDAGSRRIIDVNQAAEQLYGYSHGEFLSLRATDLEDRETPDRHRTKHGEPLDVELHAATITWHDAPARIVIVDDATGRRRLEEQLLQSQKMEAVGQLAGGIAHDFNNLLTAIQGYAELLSDGLGHDPARQNDVNEIARASRQAASLTRQLLAFSRKQVLAPTPLRVGDVVAGLTPMLRRLIGETIDVRTEVTDHAIVCADRGQLETVVMNLVVNSRDAMPGGGRLTLETRDVRFAPGDAAPDDLAPGAYVRLAVSDTGHGMDAAMRARVFEPFYTTKPEGQGTGLGLSTVYGIVKQSGGHVAVESEPGHGTTFWVFLPATAQELDAIEPAPPIRADVYGRETILVVEDDPGLRGFLEVVLRRYGYGVHAVSEPGLALEFATQHQASIDLVLTDVVMPEMGGPALAARIRATVPDMPVVFMTGYTDERLATGSTVPPGAPLIRKPFTPERLTTKIRDVLDTGPRGRRRPA